METSVFDLCDAHYVESSTFFSVYQRKTRQNSAVVLVTESNRSVLDMDHSSLILNLLSVDPDATD